MSDHHMLLFLKLQISDILPPGLIPNYKSKQPECIDLTATADQFDPS